MKTFFAVLLSVVTLKGGWAQLNEEEWNATWIRLDQTQTVKAYVCNLPFSPGQRCDRPATAPANFVYPTVNRWRFNPTLRQCEVFLYYGCKGNANNFPDQEYCINYCFEQQANLCPLGGQPYVDGFGRRPNCGGFGGRVCPITHECVTTTERLQTVNLCCPTRSTICRLNPDPGIKCTNRVQFRWYYNLAAKRCVQLYYNGCGGNANSFETSVGCQDFCDSAACRTGEEVYVDPKSRTTRSCTISSGCPSGYVCRDDSVNIRSVCCGSTDEGLCPVGTQIFIDTYINDAKTCQPNVVGSCGNGFLCVLGTDNNYYCCRALKGFCPTGAQALVATGSSVITCPLNSYNTCPNGYQCATSIPGAFEGYCCSGSTTVTAAQCPTGSSPLVDSVTKLAISCNLVANICPAPGYTCQTSTALVSYVATQPGFCCSIPNLCPSGYDVINNTYGQMQSCFFGAPNACSAGSCISFLGSSQGFCCQQQPATTTTAVATTTTAPSPPAPSVCSAGMKSFLDANKVAVGCDPYNNPCQPGFACQYNAVQFKYFCCTLDVGCSGSNSYPEIDATLGDVRSCNPSSPACSKGFSCVATSGKSLCCSTTADTTTSLATTTATVATTVTTVAASPVTELICILGFDNGQPCAQQLPQLRWYFDSKFQMCRQFLFYGCGGNNNHFRTAADCNRSCLNSRIRQSSRVTCEMGVALRDPTNPLVDKVCSATTACPNGFECTAVGATSVCCPTRATTCLQPKLVGATCNSDRPSTRFAFDPATGSCAQFNYNGCFGNDNNFMSVNDCMAYCVSGMCPKGMPIIINGVVRTCTDDSTCGPNYQCVKPEFGSTSNVCCQTKTFICGLPPDRGTACPNIVSTPQLWYYFNPTTKTCSTFEFLGCGGNDNYFKDDSACKKFCDSPVTPSQLCPTGRTVGNIFGTTSPQPCSLTVPNTCLSGFSCAAPTTAGGQAYCCSDVVTPTTQYCPVGRTVGFIFNTQTPQPCSLSAPEACLSGFSCTAPVTTGGQSYCCSSPTTPVTVNVCQVGQTVQLITGTQSPQACIPGQSPTPCQSGYACLFGTNGQFYCCTGSSLQYCPTGSSPWVTQGSMAALGCPSPASAVCPSGFVCSLSPSLANQYFCCSSPTPAPVTTNSCPSGTNSYVFTGTTTVQTCNPAAPNCPNGYSCVIGSLNQYLCCIGGTLSQFCPINVSPQLIAGTANAQPCTLTAPTTCSSGYSCQQGPTGQYYCCLGVSPPVPVANVCPTGTTAQMVLGSTTVTLSCAAGSTTSCQSGYSCQLGLDGKYYCCSNPAVKPVVPTTTYCPGTMSPFYYPGTLLPLVCDPRSLTTFCPANFGCQPSPSGTNYFCCGIATPKSLDCPTGNPLMMSANQPWICTPGSTTSVCPNPSTCQYSQTRGQYVCCIAGVASAADISPTGTKTGTNSNDTASVTAKPKSEDATTPSASRILKIDDPRCAVILLDVNPYCMWGGENSCPSPFSCEYVATRRAYYCCKPPTAELSPSPATEAASCESGKIQLKDKSGKSSCYPTLAPGEGSCVDPIQCRYPGSYCSNGICNCPANLLLHDKQCVFSCPSGFSNVQGSCKSLFTVRRAQTAWDNLG